MKAQSITVFIERLKEEFGQDTAIPESGQKIEDLSLSNKECLFTWSPISGKMIQRRGFQNLLGIDDQILTLERFVSLMHPEDVELVKKIGQAATVQSVEHPKGNNEWMLYVAYRIRKSDGTFIKVLAQISPFQFDKQKRITEFLVRINDISFAGLNGLVEYDFRHPGLNSTEFKKLIYDEAYSLFTPKETEIIKLIGQGKKSQEIAEVLNISKHTVATHRKKIMKKSNCHSKKELMRFCKKNGIL